MIKYNNKAQSTLEVTFSMIATLFLFLAIGYIFLWFNTNIINRQIVFETHSDYGRRMASGPLDHKDQTGNQVDEDEVGRLEIFEELETKDIP